MLMKTSVYEKYASVNIIWHYVNSLHNTLELDSVSWQLPGRELSRPNTTLKSAIIMSS